MATKATNAKAAERRRTKLRKKEQPIKRTLKMKKKTALASPPAIVI